MSTGISSLSKLPELTTLYPFAGAEFVYTLILLGFIVLFFMWQTTMEQLHIRKIVGEAKKEAAPSSAAFSPAE
jgi:hypothetical protein